MSFSKLTVISSVLKQNNFLSKFHKCQQIIKFNEINNITRYYSTTSQRHHAQTTQARPDWNRAVSEAEKIVGYPTSFLSLRWLLSDEIANIALHLRRLVGSNHPLLQTAKNLLYNAKSNMQAWGLIVLLVSKTAGHSDKVPDLEQDKAAGVLHSQRALAEVTEMIRTSHLVHKGLVNIKPEDTSESADDMTFGNKIALLSGDYLLGNSCVELANLRNQNITELISSALRDLAESEFIGIRDEQNNPLPIPPSNNAYIQESDTINEPHSNLEPIPPVADGDVEGEWTLRHILGAGSLLGKSCQGTVHLAGHPPEAQHRAYLFGKHLALAWQACVELEPFLMSKCPPYNSTLSSGSSPPFSIASAPVVFALKHDPSLYIELEAGRKSVLDVNYETVWHRVKEGPGVQMARDLQMKHSKAAIDVLEYFPDNDARKALKNIIFAMQVL